MNSFWNLDLSRKVNPQPWKLIFKIISSEIFFFKLIVTVPADYKWSHPRRTDLLKSDGSYSSGSKLWSIDSWVGARPLSPDQKALLHFKHPPAAQHDDACTGCFRQAVIFTKNTKNVTFCRSMTEHVKWSILLPSNMGRLKLKKTLPKRACSWK